LIRKSTGGAAIPEPEAENIYPAANRFAVGETGPKFSRMANIREPLSFAGIIRSRYGG